MLVTRGEYEEFVTLNFGKETLILVQFIFIVEKTLYTPIIYSVLADGKKIASLSFINISRF